MTAYDVAAVRRDFPILSRTVHDNKPLIYLDNAASVQKPQAMLDAVQKAYSYSYANVHRGLHTLSNEATDAFEAARKVVARFLNAPSDNDIVFTHNATEAINLVAQAFTAGRIQEGDEIVLTILEHHSNVVPWHFLRERQGAVLKWVDVDDQGNLDLDVFEAALSDKTKMVAVTHMSNVTGTITPVRQLIDLAHKRDIPVLVDGSQAAVHMPVDVQGLDADFYVVTAHKLYGPSGIGALYGRQEYLREAKPFLGGGEMISDVFVDKVTYQEPPHRFEAGTPPIVQAVGFAAGLNYMEKLGRHAIAAYETELVTYAREKFLAIDNLRLIGDPEQKGGVFCFEIKDIHAHDMATILDRYGIAVRAGTHCAQPLLTRFGCSSTARASFALYTTRDEIDALCDGLEKVKGFF